MARFHETPRFSALQPRQDLFKNDFQPRRSSVFDENSPQLVKKICLQTLSLLAKREHEMFVVTEKKSFQAFVRNWWVFWPLKMLWLYTNILNLFQVASLRIINRESVCSNVDMVKVKTKFSSCWTSKVYSPWHTQAFLLPYTESQRIIFFLVWNEMQRFNRK